jgi:uncharacterized RDD family membrane protein YckC
VTQGHCTACGSPVPAGASFCPSCGRPVRPDEAPPVVLTEMGSAAATTYASFWKRFVAWIIDTIILGVVGAIIQFIIPGGSSTEDASTAALVAANTASFVVPWAYYAGMESSVKQGTLGKMAMGIVVTDMKGERITFMRATGRYFAKIVSTMILLIGFLMIAFTKRKQGLHDIMAQTLVVNKK